MYFDHNSSGMTFAMHENNDEKGGCIYKDYHGYLICKFSFLKYFYVTVLKPDEIDLSLSKLLSFLIYIYLLMKFSTTLKRTFKVFMKKRAPTGLGPDSSSSKSMLAF